MLAAVADLEAALGRTIDTAEQPAAVAALDVASAAARDVTGQTLSRVTADVARLRGSWAAELVLPQRPVVGVTAVHLVARALVADVDYWWDGTDRLVRGARPTGDSVVAAGHWGGPAAVVTVTYTHGFDPVPDGVRRAVAAIAARLMASPLGVRSETIGEHSVSFGPVELTALERGRARAVPGPDAQLVMGPTLTRWVVVERRAAAGTVDGYGNPVEFTAAAHVVRGELQQQARGEDDRDRATASSDWLLVVEAGTPLEAGDRVVVDGDRFEVIGPPERVWHPWARRHTHVEATVRRTTG